MLRGKKALHSRLIQNEIYLHTSSHIAKKNTVSDLYFDLPQYFSSLRTHACLLSLPGVFGKRKNTVLHGAS